MPPAADIVDEDGVHHRLWAVPADGDAAAALAPLISVAADRPVYIADGHHRYETALRYRDERRMARSCEEDPAFDYILTLFVDAVGEQLTVLPTHRIVRGLGDDGVDRLLSCLDDLFDVRRDVDAAELVARFESGGPGIGWCRRVRALDPPRRRTAERPTRRVRAVPAAGWRRRPSPGRHASGRRPRTTRGDRRRRSGRGGHRLHQVRGRCRRARRCREWRRGRRFLLEPTPIASVLAVATDGDVMPQKSTYFYPKALTGLVINPHEW